MTDAGEVAADIGLEYVVHLLGHDLQAQRLQSVVRVAPRSKAVTAVEEIRFKHGLDNARYRPRQQPMRDRGDALWARSGFAWSFGYFNPPDRWCAIGAGSKLCANFFNPLLQLALKLLGALPVDAAFLVRESPLLRRHEVTACTISAFSDAVRSRFTIHDPGNT